MSSTNSIDALLPPIPKGPLKVAISACGAGKAVRFDGASKGSSFPKKRLEGVLTLVPICPEVGIGLGTPRDTLRLVGEIDGQRVASSEARATSNGKGKTDLTDELRGFAERNKSLLADLHGHLFMQDSPSCGLNKVRVYRGVNKQPVRDGRGIYAGAVVRQHPDLPVEECGRMFDAHLRENYVNRVYVHARWQALLAEGLTPKKLVAFHSAHKLLAMAHDPAGISGLGQIVANLDGNVTEIGARYFSALMRSLSKGATRGTHANTLSHLQGYVKRDLVPAVRQELASVIEGYRKAHLPLLAPLTLLKHHLARHEKAYALSQAYLAPHPVEAGLRCEL
jgi:uncharacterized protein YbgA (DUF1722 family)/uncharacterized protein YbbK (DUF523 family)